LVFDKRTFDVRVCIETFLVSWTTGPGWWMGGNRGSVWMCVKKEHDMIHHIAREIRKLGQGVKDILFFCGQGGMRG